MKCPASFVKRTFALVKEYVYKTDLGAKKKIRKLMDIGTSEFTVCSVDRIHYMKPNNDYEDEYDEEY